MNDNVQKALEERRKRQENEKQQRIDSYEQSRARVDEALNNRARILSQNVDENYINTFLSDANRFISGAQTAYEKLGWGNAANAFSNQKSTFDELTSRYSKVRGWLTTNKNSITEDSYNSLFDSLESFRSGASSIVDSFREARDYYSQWETEDDYNQYVAQQKDYEEKKNFDIEAGQKEIEYLERLYDEYSVLSRTVTDERGAARLQEIKDQYGYTYDLKDLISQKKAYLNQAKHIQEGITLSGAIDHEDFNDYSGYVSTKSDGFFDRLTSDYGMGYDDITYEYINNQNGIRDEIKQKHRTYSHDSGDSESEFEEKGYDYLHEDEISIYNYYYAKEGKEKANEYLDSIQETLNQRKATSMYEDMEDDTVLELAFGVAAGLDQFKSGMNGLKSAFTGEDDYIPVSAYQMASAMVREDLGDTGFKLPDFMGGASIGQIAYDTVTTTSNMLPSILASTYVGAINPVAGKIVGAGLLGSSAAGNGYQEMLNLGYDKNQARMYAALVGASEAGLEYLIGGISKLGGAITGNAVGQILNNVDNVFARIAIKLGSSMASEFTEEYLQDVLEPWFQNLVLGTENDIKLFSADALYSGLLGALTAGVMEGGGIVSGEINTYKQGKELQKAGITAQRLSEIGKTFSADTVAYQLAGKVNENTGAYTIGRLFNEIGASLSEQNITDITNALVAKNMDEATAKKNAEALAYVVEGGKLTDMQIAVIEANDVLSEVARTTLIDQNTTWNQRTKGYNEVLKSLADEMVSQDSYKNNPSQESGEKRVESDTDNDGNKNVTHGTYEDDTVDTSPAKVQSISAIANKQATVRLEDGTEINARDADLSPDDGVRIETIANIDGISANDANFILNVLRTNTNSSAQMDALGAKEAYTYGYYGFSKEHMTSHGVFSGSLTESQRNEIYETGRNASQRDVEKKQSDDAGKKLTGEKTGKLHFDGDESKLNDIQRTSLKALEKIADALGVQIYIFESEVNEKGKRVGKNGWYDPKDGSIHIDLYAGADGRGTMLFTAAHELTHLIKDRSDAKFKILADFLMQEYGKAGVNVDLLVREQIKKAKRNGRTISYKEAYEEMVCDSMETMLSDGNVVEKLAKLKQKDRTLWEMIKDFISELAAKIRAVYDGLNPDSVEGNYVKDMVDAVDQLQNLFTEALVEASENYQASLTPGEESVVVSENGDPVAYSTEDGSVKLSLRTYDEEGRRAFRDYLSKCVSSNKLTKAEMHEMMDGIEDIYQTCKEFKDKYAPFGTWSDASVVRDTYGNPVFSVVTPNGEYKMNMDFSLVCKKRRTLDAVFNEMAKRGIIDDFELGQKSVVKINEIIRKHGFETACALCFVDAKRFRQASMADSFTSLYNELVQSLVPEDQRGSIDHFNLSGYETIKKVANGIHTWNSSKLDFSHLKDVMKNYGNGTVEHKAAKYIMSHPEGRKLLLRGDFMSSKGFDAVKTQNKDILKLYNSKKGTGGPKAAFGDVQYMNEVIKKAKTWTPEKAYAVGGIRIQSFSDYVPRMVFDYAQMIYDLAATKLPAHAYTKEALFAKQFGLTGVKINMSLIPAIAEGGIAPGLDAKGNYVWAGESFDFETAKQIQNAPGYSENCGTICVGVSYAHIVKLLSDPDIRMVIPYHKSGFNPIVAHMNKIADFTDYTGSQNTLDGDGKKVAKDFDFNKELRSVGDPKVAVANYLAWCDSKGYTPKFAEFRWHENYYKLIEDFTLYDNYGSYVPQREVRAVFPTSESSFGSMKDLIKAGLEEDAVIEGKRDKSLSSIVDEIQNTLPKTEAEIAETEVVQADRDLESELADSGIKYSGGAKYSTRDYSDQVDEVKNNTHDPNNHVYMGTTPAGIANVLDLPKLPVLITSQHIYSMAVSEQQAKMEGRFKSRMNYHDLGWNVVKKLPEYINKPVFIIKSNTDPIDATFVVITAETDKAGRPIIAAIKPNGVGNYFDIEIPSNFMLSGYGRNKVQNYVATAKTENRILYASKKNSQKLKNTPGVQFADNILTSDYTNNLAQFKSIVKSKFTGTIFENSGLPKFSDRDTESFSNRSLLANAFESVAQNEIEKQKIQEYKGRIERIHAEEQKLAELNQKIKELSFAKGTKDTKAITDLQIEKKQTENRINTLDKILLQLEASKPLQNVLQREKKMAYKRAEQKGREALAEYKEKSAKTQRELLDRWQKSREKGIDSRNRTAMRHKIKNVVNELNDYLLKGTKDRHVPESMQKAVASALDAVNMDTVGAEERIAKLTEEMMKAKTPEKIQEISRKIDNIRMMGDKMSERLKKLRDAYDDLLKSPDVNTQNSYDEVIHNKLESVIGKIGDTALRDMTLSQLEDLYDMYRMVLKSVRDANKSFKDEKKRSISVRAGAVMSQVEKVGGKRKLSPKILNGIEKFGWDNLKPVYAFEHIGSDTLTEAFKNVRKGEDVWAVDVMEAREFYLDKSQKYHYDSWDFNKQYTFTSTSGMDFNLNLEQILSLYAYSKRDQAADHLKYGGIVFDESTKIVKKTKLGLSLEFNPTDATAYNISTETLSDIISKLTNEQKAFADEMQDYLSTVMGEKGNEVSMAMYDILLFKEKNYFPLKSAQQFMEKAREQQKGEVKLKNAGFSKETVPKAKNPIVLTPFMDVWADHVNEMSMYHAFVLPLEDFYRIYNYKTPSNNESLATEGVNQYIQNAYGRAATAYIDQLLKDLNGGARMDTRTGIINTMMGKFKKGAVFASASVVIQQPSAIARAAALIEPKYFIGQKVDSKRHKALWEEVKKYAPVAIIKEMGYFDTNMGKSTQDFIKGKEYEGIKDKAKALVKDSNYRDEVLSKAPALADEIAWCGIWEAVKRETQAKYPGMDTKAEPFLKLCGDRFTEVITKTQVYDSVLSRSALMRSKDTGMKMMTAFMAEPTTSLNMLVDALVQGKRGNIKYCRSAIGAVIAAQILNSILVSFVYAARDDDDDETYLEKYVGSFSGSVVDGLNPLTYIPFIKDIVSVVKGYDVERADMSVVSDMVKALENLNKDTVSPYRKVEGFAGSIANMFGLPVKNIMRDVRSIYQVVNTFRSGQKTTKSGIGYAIQGAVTGKTDNNQQQLYDAIMSGDQTQIARVKGRFKDQNAINTAIRTALRENDPRIREAAIAWNAGDLNQYMSIAKEIIREGHFVQDDVVLAIRAEANKLTTDGETESTSKAKGLFTADSFAEAISQGDQAMANAIRTDIIQTAQKNGKSEEEAIDSFNSSAKAALKESFMAGNISDRDATNALVDYCDIGEDSATADVLYWTFTKEYPDTYVSDSWFDKYVKDVSDSGISVETYVEYKNEAKGIDGDGKKERLMEIIDSLPITSAQKDALYFAEGWAESKLYEAPWH